MTQNGWSFSTTTGPKHRPATRFNLLLLEHGEVFFQDFSVYMLPLPSRERPFWRCAKMRQQGRLKLCSRSLCFEPADMQAPLLKFPLRSVRGGIRYNPVDTTECELSDLDGEKLFRFMTDAVIEMKEGGRIGPFEQHMRGRDGPGGPAATNRPSPPGARRSGSGSMGSMPGSSRSRAHDKDEDWTFLFALVHTSTDHFSRAVSKIMDIVKVVVERGISAENELLEPLLRDLQGDILNFDSMHLVNFREKILMQHPMPVNRVIPLLKLPGCLMVTDARVYFQPSELNNTGEAVLSFELRAIRALYKRRHVLKHVGLEFFLDSDARVQNHSGPSSGFFFAFETSNERDAIYQLIARECAKTSRGARAKAPLSLGGNWEPAASYTSSIQSNLNKLTRLWQERRISNFEYLQHLNTIADRSTNDLTQYPVYPWVIADYSSSTLDLSSPDTFRDLSRPIGALNPTRLEGFKERFKTMPKEDRELGIPPPFLYGTHYSTPGYVLFFLLRSSPEHMLCLQNGRWDSPDRMFISIQRTWDSVLQNTADLKELVPEFYSGNGDFLTNSQGLDLGMTQRRDRVDDVELPPWAKSPRDFVRKCRKALESEYVSEHLHLWIDLIFGYKQKGHAALESDNLFYYLTYEGAVDLDSFDSTERAGLEAQISEFGQCPRQLFSAAHPSRNSPILASEPADTKPASESTPARRGTIEDVLNSMEGRPSYLPESPLETPIVTSDLSALLNNESKESRSEAKSDDPASGGLMKVMSFLTRTRSEDSDQVDNTTAQPASSISPWLTTESSLDSDPVLSGKVATITVALPEALEPKEASFSDDHPELSLQASRVDRLRDGAGSTKADPSSGMLLRAPPAALTGWGFGEDTRIVGSVPFKLHDDPVTSVWLADDLCTLATSSRDASLKITALEKDAGDKESAGSHLHSTARLRRTFASSDLTLSSCALTPDGSVAVVGSWDNTALVYNVESACVVSRCEVHDDSVSCLDLVPDPSGLLLQNLEQMSKADPGFLIATGAWDATVKLWVLRLSESGKKDFGSHPLLELYDMESPVTCVAVAGGNSGLVDPTVEGTRVAAGADNGEVGMWDITIPSGLLLASVWAGAEGRRGPAATCCRWASCKGSLELFTSAVDGCIRRFDVQGNCLSRLCLRRAFEPVGIRSIVTDGQVILGGCDDGSIRGWKASMENDSAAIFTVDEAHADAVNCLFISREGKVLVSGGGDNCVRIWTFTV